MLTALTTMMPLLQSKTYQSNSSENETHGSSYHLSSYECPKVLIKASRLLLSITSAGRKFQLSTTLLLKRLYRILELNLVLLHIGPHAEVARNYGH